MLFNSVFSMIIPERNESSPCSHTVRNLMWDIRELAAPSTKENGLQSSVTLNVVRVFEVNPPKGSAPIEWRLATTEPIKTKKDLENIVDADRSRWTIEEFFKALKTGCAFEKRQLESYDALLKALAIFAPIAYELLRLRSAARQTTAVPANTFFRPSLWTVLQRHKDLLCDPDSIVRDCYLAIARLGGHLKSIGEPGWLILARGYEKLLAIEEGVMIFSEICDQS
jgi:hypothetical protein